MVTVTAFLIGQFLDFLLSLGWGWIALDHCILVGGGPTFQELCKVERDKERTRDPPPSDGCDIHQPTDHQARLVAHGGPWHSTSPVWEFNLGPPGRPYSWKQQAKQVGNQIALAYKSLQIPSGKRLQRPNLSDICAGGGDFPMLRHCKGRGIRHFSLVAIELAGHHTGTSWGHKRL